jgi:hypothetical protein
MSDARKGIRLSLSPARKMVGELLYHARKVPSIPLSRRLNVAAVSNARRLCTSPPSWMAIFVRAYGLLSTRHVVLRRAYIRWPIPHLYEHPVSECAVTVEREWRGEAVTLGAKIRQPETMPVAVISEHLQRFREEPVESISAFRQILRLGRLPWPIRRFVFWQTLNWSGAKRAKRFGTFMASSLGPLGVHQEHSLAPFTTHFSFGPIAADGAVTVRIVYDHRVTDGRTIGRCLADLQSVLDNELVSELRGLARRAA